MTNDPGLTLDLLSLNRWNRLCFTYLDTAISLNSCVTTMIHLLMILRLEQNTLWLLDHQQYLGVGKISPSDRVGERK